MPRVVVTEGRGIGAWFARGASPGEAMTKDAQDSKKEPKAPKKEKVPSKEPKASTKASTKASPKVSPKASKKEKVPSKEPKGKKKRKGRSIRSRLLSAIPPPGQRA